MENKKIAPADLDHLQEHKHNVSTTGIVPVKGYTVKMNIDQQPFSQKPKGAAIAAIRKRLAANGPQDLEIRALPQFIENGCSFTPGAMTGTDSSSWISQQLFCVDIDNVGKDGKPLQKPMSAPECVEILNRHSVPALFCYSTFSNTQGLPKFRICVLCDQAVTDPEEAGKIQKGLTHLFRGADQKTVDLSRIFFGSSEGCVCYPFTDKAASKAALLALDAPKKAAAPTSTPAPARAVKNLTGAQLGDEIERFDLAAYVEATTGQRGHRSGNRVLFHDCPVCGHHDDFDVTGPKWSCRSASNSTGITGGNVINYLEAVRGCSQAEARQIFKSECLGIDLKEEKEAWRAERLKADFTRDQSAAQDQEDRVPPFILQHVNKKTGAVTESVSAPQLADYVRKHEHYIFERNGALGNVNRFWYIPAGYYRQVADDEIKGYIKQYIQQYDLNLVKMRDVDEVFRQITTDQRFHDQSEINHDEGIINFRNGVLDLATLELSPHDPGHLCTRQIPVDWISSPRETPVFDRFMQFFLTGETTGKLDTTNPTYCLLLEFLGACISNVKGPRFKKALFMYGPGNSGKSQLRSLAEYLIGTENCSPCDLKQLESRFGTSTVYGKRLVGSSDMSYATVAEMAVFKQLTSEDPINCEFKGRQAFHFFFDGFVWFCMNRLPKFGGDNGQWVFDRIIPVKAAYTVPEDQRDPLLLDKMKQEAGSIAFKAVMALRAAVARGYRFTIPAESLEIRQEYRRTNNTFEGWFSERCIDIAEPGSEENRETVEAWKADPRHAPSIRSMYCDYANWCREYENGFKLKYTDFREEALQKYGNRSMEKRPSGMVFTTFCLTKEAAEEAWRNV